MRDSFSVMCKLLLMEVVVVLLLIIVTLPNRPVESCYVFPADSVDPCLEKQCPPGARCVVGPTREPSCVCPQHCPQYGDHAASRPLCATDNRDYRDLCHMRKAACAQGKEINLKLHGACGKLKFNFINIIESLSITFFTLIIN